MIPVFKSYRSRPDYLDIKEYRAYVERKIRLENGGPLGLKNHEDYKVIEVSKVTKR